MKFVSPGAKVAAFVALAASLKRLRENAAYLRAIDHKGRSPR